MSALSVICAIAINARAQGTGYPGPVPPTPPPAPTPRPAPAPAPTPAPAGHDHSHHGHSHAAPATPAPARATSVSSIASNVRWASTPGEASGYLAIPKVAGRKPAIIVIQEWWGLNDWVRQQTDRFAAQGYVALAVDLYRGKVTTDPAVAHELARGLPEDRAMADLKSAYNYLASRADVDATRIGAIGWCMGGGYALGLAVNEPRLKAVVINYGRLITNADSLKKINAAILGHFGAKDRGIPVDDVRAFTATLVEAGKNVDVKIYDDAGHAFMNEDNKQGWNAAAAADAQKRTDDFFTKFLRG